jgi:hypothetical protein
MGSHELAVSVAAAARAPSFLCDEGVFLIERVAFFARLFFACPLVMFVKKILLHFGHNFEVRQPACRALNNRVSFNASNLRKFVCLVFPTFYSDKERVSSIQHLLSARSPFAIIWRVAAIVVYALDEEAARPRTNVRDERSERFSPSLANSDSSPAVVGVLRTIRIVASVNHAPPRVVQRRDFFIRHGAKYNRSSEHS